MGITLDDCQKYLNTLCEEKPNTIDEMMNLTGFDADKCYAIHDFIHGIGERLTGSSDYVELKAIREQMSKVHALSSLLADRYNNEAARSDDLQLHKEMRTAWMDSVKVYKDLQASHDKLQSKSTGNNAVGDVLKTLFSILASVDPVVAVRVRDDVVKKLSALVNTLPIFPGVDDRG